MYELRKLFAELKPKCKTASQMRSFNELIKCFTLNSVDFNNESIKIAKAWDSLYNSLRCQKSLYGRGGDTCYMYIEGCDKSGNQKILIRVLDWNNLIIFKPASASKGLKYQGSLDQLYNDYSSLYMIPKLYTEPSLYKKLGDYVPELFTHYLKGSDAKSIINGLTNNITNRIVSTIDTIKSNPKNALVVTKIEFTHKNFPEIYNILDNLIEVTGFKFENMTEEEINECSDKMTSYLDTRFNKVQDSYHNGESYVVQADNITWLLFVTKGNYCGLRGHAKDVYVSSGISLTYSYGFFKGPNISGDFPNAKNYSGNYIKTTELNWK